MEDMAKNELRQKISDYNEIIVSFANVLRQENIALQAFDVTAVSDLYEQKSKLSLAYRSMVSFFIKHQEELKAISEEVKNILKKKLFRTGEAI